MAAFIKRTKSVYVSHHHAAILWRETFKAAPDGYVHGEQATDTPREDRRQSRNSLRTILNRGNRIT